LGRRPFLKSGRSSAPPAPACSEIESIMYEHENVIEQHIQSGVVLF
jgi:hypothetical protein